MNDTTEQVVFEPAIEGLRRILLPRLSADQWKQFKELGIDFDAALLPAYPFEVWTKALELAARVLWPNEPRDAALFKLGEAFVGGYDGTLLGRAVLAFIRIVGARRALARAERSFRSSNNFAQTRSTDIDATTTELWVNEVRPAPDFTRGVVSGALKLAGVVPRIELKDFDGRAATFRCSWTTS